MDWSGAISRLSQLCERVIGRPVVALHTRVRAFATLHLPFRPHPDAPEASPRRLTLDAILSALRAPAALAMFARAVPLDDLARAAGIVAAREQRPQAAFWTPPLTGASAVHAP